MNQKLSDNKKRLLARVVARHAIPSGGELADGIAFISNPKEVARVTRESLEWIDAAIATVKTAPDNPYGDDDEAIIAEILRQIGDTPAPREGGDQEE